MKAQTFAVLTLVNLSILHGQAMAPSNGSATPPAYATPTPPVNGRTSPPALPQPGNISPASDGIYRSPDGKWIAKGPLPSNPDPTTPEAWRRMLVERLILLPSPVRNGAPQLYGMGDEAALDVLRVLGTRGPLTPAEQRSILDVIGMAFEHPKSIIDPNYRTPDATMFLLKFISSSAVDSSVKERAATQLAQVQAIKMASRP